jgi:hypothetical protein
MNFELPEAQKEIVRHVRTLFTNFPDEYWCDHDRRAECRLLKIAPMSQEMMLNSIAEHVPGLPRSH